MSPTRPTPSARGPETRGTRASATETSRSGGWSAQDFSPARWPDFEQLFRRNRGVQAGCWCMFYHREGPNGPLESTERQESNRRDHRELLFRGHADGVLVYRDGEPVGWCQFGRREDLPRIERGRNYRSLAADLAPPPTWRITCFFVDRPSRRVGVAQYALHAALGAIRRRGGGVVEAYPVTRPNAVAVWFGTVGMFRREGFELVRPFGRSNALMRTTLRPSPS